MKKVVSPNDLKGLQKSYTNKVLFSFLKYMAIAIILCILLHFKVKCEDYSNADRVYYIYATFLAIPFLATGIIKKLSAFSWYGKIDDIKVKTITSYRTINGRSFRTVLTHTIQLKVKTEKGIKKAIAYSTKKPTVKRKDDYFSKKSVEVTDIDEELTRYKKGYAIAHVYGFDKLWVKREETVTCIVCGKENGDTEGKCSACNHSLIRRYSTIQ